MFRARVQGYLAHKKPPPPLGPPKQPRHGPTVGSYGVGVSYERGTPVGVKTLQGGSRTPGRSARACTEREIFIDILLVRVHLIIEMSRPALRHGSLNSLF